MSAAAVSPFGVGRPQRSARGAARGQNDGQHATTEPTPGNRVRNAAARATRLIPRLLAVPRRAKKHPRKSPPEALVSALEDAVDAGIIVSKHASVMTHHPTKTRSRISPVFAAAREAVVGERPGKISQRVFDTAGHAAAKAMEDSARPIEYELMADGILGIPDHAIWMAARHAAGDLFYRLPAEKRERRGGDLLEKAGNAAVAAARDRLGRGGGRTFQKRPEAGGHPGRDGSPQFRAAVVSTRRLASDVAGVVEDTASVGTALHAATAATFGAAVKGPPPGGLAGAVGKACGAISEAVIRHDRMAGSVVAALCGEIRHAAVCWPNARAAVRGSENLLLDRAADRTFIAMGESSFEAAYEALAACAYAASGKYAFKRAYESAAAEACGVELPEPPKAAGRGAGRRGASDALPDEFLQELYRPRYDAAGEAADARKAALRRSVFPAVLLTNYVAAAAHGGGMGAVMFLYRAAYRAGAEAAEPVIA